MNDHRFAGAKVMIFLGQDLLVLRRDHAPGLVWPGMLDFPGGGREGTETPLDCAIREAREEVGLVLSPDDLRLAHLRDAHGRRSWFFAAHLAKGRQTDIVFGGEGAGWQLMSQREFIAAPDAIPHFRVILETYLRKRPEGANPSGQ